MPQILQGPLDSCVPPRRILGGYPAPWSHVTGRSAFNSEGGAREKNSLRTSVHHAAAVARANSTEDHPQPEQPAPDVHTGEILAWHPHCSRQYGMTGPLS